jgi:proline iminopeptidase
MPAVAMTSEGFLQHRGHDVWWGEASTAPPSRLPLLTIHGGPGICHDCLEPLAALGDQRRVIFYDQYGCGRSDRAADPEEYDLDLFVEEIGAVRSALGLDEVHLYAHSYGGPLALAYLLTHPDGVASLTVSNSFASVPALADGWARRLAELPASTAAVLREGGAGDPEAYGAALGEFLGRFVLPFAPPEPLMRSQQHSGAEVYARMHGSSWFSPDGELADFDVVDRLGEIAVPALVIGGTRDQCVPELSEAMAAGLPQARLAVLETAHLPFFESPEAYLELLAGFLDDVDLATAQT